MYKIIYIVIYEGACEVVEKWKLSSSCPEGDNSLILSHYE